MQTSKPNTSMALAPGVRRTLELLASGLYTDEVAERLCTDPDTIRHYVAQAMAILGARSKLEAVVIALRLGLVEVDQAECSGRWGG